MISSQKKKEKKICVNCVHVSRELGKVMERRWLLFYLEVMSHTDHFSFTVHVYHKSALSSAILNTMKMIYEREKFSGIFHSRSGPIIYETLIIISKRSPRNDNPTKLVPTDFVSTISKWLDLKHRWIHRFRGTRRFVVLIDPFVCWEPIENETIFSSWILITKR